MVKLLIVGATGLVGREALKRALDDKRVTHVIAVTRRPLPDHPKLKNHVLDFDDLPTEAAWWKVDGVICALGTTRRETPNRKAYHKIDIEYPISIAHITHKAGAKSFALVSSMGASISSPFAYLKGKGEVETALQKIGFQSLTIVRPSFIAGVREKPRAMEAAFFSLLKIVEPLLPKRWRSVSAQNIAHAMLEAIIKADKGVAVRESETLI